MILHQHMGWFGDLQDKVTLSKLLHMWCPNLLNLTLEAQSRAEECAQCAADEGVPCIDCTGGGKTAPATYSTSQLRRLQRSADKAALRMVLHSRHWSCSALTPAVCPTLSSEQECQLRAEGPVLCTVLYVS